MTRAVTVNPFLRPNWSRPLSEVDRLAARRRQEEARAQLKRSWFQGGPRNDTPRAEDFDGLGDGWGRF